MTSAPFRHDLAFLNLKGKKLFIQLPGCLV